MVDKYAQIIWDYMKLGNQLKHCDAILVFGGVDERIAEYGSRLFLDGYGDRLIVTGGIAHTDDLLATGWNETEGERFAAIARKMGVPADKVIIENKATNNEQNILFSYELLEKMGIRLSSVLLVHRPYMERRLYATFKKRWPDETTQFIITSPPISYSEYPNESHPKDSVINVMVGDLQRIREYPKLGYQVPQDIPPGVWHAYEELVKLGYDKHLIKP